MKQPGWIVLLALFGLLFSGTIASERAQAVNTPSQQEIETSSMETIRKAVNRPEVQERLRERGISRADVEYRLSMLDSNLSRNQKQALAQQLTQTESRTSRSDLPATSGNRFLGTTLDVVTSIILLPIKIVAWFIPGL